MSINLEKMSRQELETLAKDVERALKTLEARQRNAALAAAEEAAKTHGFKLAELLGGDTPAKRVAVPKYKNPANPEQTWTGRGRKPGWLLEALAKGTPLEDLEI